MLILHLQLSTPPIHSFRWKPGTMIFVILSLTILSLVAAAPSCPGETTLNGRGVAPPNGNTLLGGGENPPAPNIPNLLSTRQSQDCISRSLSDFHWVLSINYSGRVLYGSPDGYPLLPSQANITFTALNSATGLTTACTFSEAQFTSLGNSLYCYSPPSLPTYPAVTTFRLARWDNRNTSADTMLELNQVWVCDNRDGEP